MKRETCKRILRVALTLLCLIGGAALVLFVWQPPCLILEKTGFYCAGCGTQRMVLDLLHLDVVGAFRQNPLMFFLLPAATAYAAVESVRYVTQKRPLWKCRRFPAAVVVVLAVAALFTVLRNLPGFGFLGPV